MTGSIPDYRRLLQGNQGLSPLCNCLVGVLVDPISGKVADESTKNATIFYYLKGTQPNRSENYLEETFKEVE